MNDLVIETSFGGENICITGTINVKGTTHVVECFASASDRGTYATVDGKEYWWCGSDLNFTNPLIEKEIERILEEAYRMARGKGIDVEADWIALVNHGVKALQINCDNEESVR